MTTGAPRPYADPYLAGVGLGLVLLAAFAFAGRGLGASGAFADSAAHVVAAVAPQRAASSAYFARYLDSEHWLLVEIAGVIAGGFVSALLAGRWHVERERAPRLMRALLGGAVMGCGAVLARGCTSGLALTGGALLAVGAWVFVMAAFAAGYLVAPLVKGAWR